MSEKEIKNIEKIINPYTTPRKLPKASYPSGDLPEEFGKVISEIDRDKYLKLATDLHKEFTRRNAEILAKYHEQIKQIREEHDKKGIPPTDIHCTQKLGEQKDKRHFPSDNLPFKYFSESHNPDWSLLVMDGPVLYSAEKIAYYQCLSEGLLFGDRPVLHTIENQYEYPYETQCLSPGRPYSLFGINFGNNNAGEVLLEVSENQVINLEIEQWGDVHIIVRLSDSLTGLRPFKGKLWIVRGHDNITSNSRPAYFCPILTVWRGESKTFELVGEGPPLFRTIKQNGVFLAGLALEDPDFYAWSVRLEHWGSGSSTTIGYPPTVARFHPNLAQGYHAEVGHLQTAYWKFIYVVYAPKGFPLIEYNKKLIPFLREINWGALYDTYSTSCFFWPTLWESAVDHIDIPK